MTVQVLQRCGFKKQRVSPEEHHPGELISAGELPAGTADGSKGWDQPPEDNSFKEKFSRRSLE